MSETLPLPSPPDPPPLTADLAVSGPAILPIDRIRLYSHSEWEGFVREWAHFVKSDYARVDRCGGAGDMGRDVVAIPDESDPTIWDNYQCKHYDHPLRPSDVWLELGKLVYYTHRGEFTYPRRYRFVAPQGVGTKLSKLLDTPDELKRQLIEQWDGQCRSRITSTGSISLDRDLRTHLDGLDFSVIGYVPPLTLIEQHRRTPWHVARFGGALPPRPADQMPPAEPADHEAVYLSKLFAAYTDSKGAAIESFDDIRDDTNLAGHYTDTRQEFYCAESLRSFSRDTLPEGTTFEQLQNEVHAGVRDTIRAAHSDGYQRILAVVGAAKSLQLTSHPLVPRLRVQDKGGIVHQLANDRDDVQWVPS